MALRFDLNEAVAFVGNLASIVAMVLLAKRRSTGWGVRLLSNALWGYYALAVASSAMTFNTLTSLAITFYGMWMWRQPQKVLDNEGNGAKV